jgi:UDP-2,3-diacylglucosamine hydrolase
VASSATAIVVSDAHLSGGSDDTTTAFHRFLETLPDNCDHLLINGDLFEFWFTYRSVIPRAVFATLAALVRVRQAGVHLTVTGGNHDSWGASFWERELDAEYFGEPAQLSLAGWSAWVAHGHGLVELDKTGRMMHRITGHPLTARTFRMIHPDLAFWMVRRLSQYLASRRRDEYLVSRATAAQTEFARDFLEDRKTVDLVVLGHTHRPALESFEENRWYLNPGAWAEGYRYAVISSAGPELRHFSF